MLPWKFRRSMAIVIPIFNVAAFFGIIAAVFKVGLTDNLVQSGITLGIILGALNLYLLWQNAKHLSP